MDFRNLMNHRIMNAADELNDGGGADVGADTGDSFGGEDRYLEPQVNDVMSDLGLDPSKYGLDKNEVSDSPEGDPHGSGETQGAGQATDENAYLEWVNSLGAVHNNNPVKVESIDEVKNALQMYKDYTQKTQSLSEERKVWDSDRTNTEKELNSAIEEFNTKTRDFDKQLQELQQWTFTLNQLQENAPDLFEEVQRAYQGTVKQFTNPILDQQLAAIRAELAETKKGLTSREDKLIVDQFETEKASMTATEQSLKELGVAIDWSEVKKQWAATGLPLKQVVGSIYFENVAKAQASKSKVETTKQKVAARPVGAASGSRPGSKVPQINRKGDYLQQARELFNNLK